MWVSGNVRRRRHTVLAEMVGAAARQGSYDAPWRLVPEVWSHYPTEAAILEALQRDWRTALAGEVYVAIEAGEGDLQADVMKAYTRVARRYEHVRKILEAHAEHPAIAHAMRKERSLLSSFLQMAQAADSAATAA